MNVYQYTAYDSLEKTLLMHLDDINCDFKSKYAPPDSDAFKRVIDAIGNEQECDKTNYKLKRP